MKIFKERLPFSVLCAAILLLVFLHVSCQYDYSSPLPGIIRVQLKTVSHNIQFSPLNNFVLTITSVEAVRANQTRVKIFGDIQAISRTGSVYNTLDYRARDSSLVLGEGYAPPDDYVGINLQIAPGNQVVLDGYRFIPVDTTGLNPILTFRKPFKVTETGSTHITLTIDLDSSLVQRTQDYFFNPLYYISSIY